MVVIAVKRKQGEKALAQIGQNLVYNVLNQNSRNTIQQMYEIMNKRKLDISILSDVHLGDYECHATELLKYLKSIDPKTLILNGDFINTKRLQKKQLPSEHIQIIKEVFQMALRGTKVYCITGDREKIIQHFSTFSSTAIDIRDKLELHLKDQKYWIFHGDTFDALFKKSRMMVKLGALAYSWLLRSDRMINNCLIRLGKARMCYAGRVKSRAKQALKAIKKFEETAMHLAIQQGYDYVICGHIHQPAIKHFKENNASVVYMNAGDWVENLTALEYNFNRWEIYEYDELDYPMINPKLHVRPKSRKDRVANVFAKSRIGSIVEPNTPQSNNVNKKIKGF